MGQKITIDDIREVERKFVDMVTRCLEEPREKYEAQPLQWLNEMPDGKMLDLRDEDRREGFADVSFEERHLFVEKAL